MQGSVNALRTPSLQPSLHPLHGCLHFFAENSKESQATNTVEENKTYSQGNYEDFVCFLSRVTKKPKPKVSCKLK